VIVGHYFITMCIADHRTAVFDQVRDDFDGVLQGVEWDLIRKLCVFVFEQQKKM
jgi:hypothetical protein